MSESSADEWFYSLKDGRVVQAHEVRAVDRLGPYPDRETAARALEIARERTEAADRADKDWADKDWADKDWADKKGGERASEDDD